MLLTSTFIFNLAYCFERYVYPAKRDMYDGRNTFFPKEAKMNLGFMQLLRATQTEPQSYTLMKDAMKVQKGESKRQDKLESKVDAGFAY